MNSELHKNIFSETECLSEQQMFDYIDGKLISAEEHAAEKHLVDCEICSDALEGLRMVQNRGVISATKQELKTIILNPEKKKSYYPYYAIAASILVIFGLWFMLNPTQEDISKNLAEVKPLNDSSQQIAETNTVVSENKNMDSTSQLASKTKKVELAMNERKIDKKVKEDIVKFNTTVSETEVAANDIDQAASGMALAKDEKAAKPVSENEAEPSIAAKSSRAEEDAVLRDDAKESKEMAKQSAERIKKSSTRNAAPSAAPQESASLFKADTSRVVVPEKLAYYTEGASSLILFIKKNMAITKETEECFGTIYSSFLVKEDGSLSDIKILKEIPNCSLLNKEAIKAIMLTSRKWIAAEINGTKVTSTYYLSIPFKN